MEQGLGFKELYEVFLKATYPIEMGGKTIEAGETIARFDKISIANFQEIKSQASANGGYDGRTLMSWEETKELRLNFSQGVFSKTQMALMTNAKLIKSKEFEPISLNTLEICETDEEGKIILSHLPNGPFYIYDRKTGEKLTDWTILNKEVFLKKPYLEVAVDYNYDYLEGYSCFQVGEPLTQGYLTFQGKMRIKDDITGQVKTGIIRIPRLKLMSDLSMRLGEGAAPQVGRFDAVALPVGGKGDKRVMEILFLEEDVDSDM